MGCDDGCIQGGMNFKNVVSSKSLLRCLSGFSEKRPDVSFQDRFHALLGFFEITSPHPDGQAFTNAFPTIISRPKHTLHSKGNDQRYFYSARLHDLVLSSTETQVASRVPILGASNSFRISHSSARVPASKVFPVAQNWPTPISELR